MKVASLLILSLLWLALMVSCNNEEEPKPDLPEPEMDEIPTEGVFYGEDLLDPSNAFIFDYGVIGTHYNQEFFILDADVMEVLSGNFDNLTFAVSADLYASGASFRQGTYRFSEALDNEGINYFQSATYLEFAEGEIQNEYDANSGTITVNGIPENYTIEYDLVLENGETVRGTFSGAFEIIDPDQVEITLPTINVDVADLTVNTRILEVYGSDGTHFNNDYILSDFDGNSASYEIYLELFSEGTEQFNTGTFSFGESDGNYFTEAYYYDYEEDLFYAFAGGTVTIEQNADEYTLTFDARMGGESTIKGTDTGVYTIQ